MYSWNSEERYFSICPLCENRFPMVKMITLKKANRYNTKNLTKICENCYIKLLDYLGINDIDLEEFEQTGNHIPRID